MQLQSLRYLLSGPLQKNLQTPALENGFEAPKDTRRTSSETLVESKQEITVKRKRDELAPRLIRSSTLEN